MVKTLTLNELAKIMRENGLSTSNERLAAEIEDKMYPFATCRRFKSGGRRMFRIYENELRAWLSEHDTAC